MRAASCEPVRFRSGSMTRTHGPAGSAASLSEEASMSMGVSLMTPARNATISSASGRKTLASSTVEGAALLQQVKTRKRRNSLAIASGLPTRMLDGQTGDGPRSRQCGPPGRGAGLPPRRDAG
jgi:hypothetical protein